MDASELSSGHGPMAVPCVTSESDSSKRPRPKNRTLAFALISILCGLAVTLVLLELLLRCLPVSSSTDTMVVDDNNPIVRFTPNRTFTFSKGWQFAITNTGRINNYGFINEQDYVKHAEHGPLTIIGDSYVEAMMVPYEQTVQGRLTHVLGKKGKVYSLGISGSQLAQYLAFAQYAWTEFHPEALVFIIVGNDFDESLAKYKKDPGFHFFQEDGGSHDLNLVRIDYQPTQAKRIMREFALARYLWGTVGIGHIGAWHGPVAQYVGNTAAHASDERLADSRRVVDYFLAELPRRIGLAKNRFLFVVDAMRPQIYSESDLKRANGSYFDLMRRYFLEQAAGHGYEAIDMQPRLIGRHQRDGSRFEFTIDAHWNDAGHQEAAEAIASSRVFASLVSH